MRPGGEHLHVLQFDNGVITVGRTGDPRMRHERHEPRLRSLPSHHQASLGLGGMAGRPVGGAPADRRLRQDRQTHASGPRVLPRRALQHRVPAGPAGAPHHVPRLPARGGGRADADARHGRTTPRNTMVSSSATFGCRATASSPHACTTRTWPPTADIRCAGASTTTLSWSAARSTPGTSGGAEPRTQPLAPGVPARL